MTSKKRIKMFSVTEKVDHQYKFLDDKITRYIYSAIREDNENTVCSTVCIVYSILSFFKNEREIIHFYMLILALRNTGMMHKKLNSSKITNRRQSEGGTHGEGQGRE